jgi:hypothetical protein
MGTINDTVWFIIPASFLVLIYLFGPQIDFWWHERHPIPLDSRLKDWLKKYLPYYNDFDDTTKELFEHRLGLYIEGREFKSVGSEIRDVPEDIKGCIASIPVRLSLKNEDFLLGDYDRIYVYSHPFPSPKMPFPHTVEIDHEDGLLLFSLEQLLPGILHPNKFFSIGMYAFLDIYFKLKSFVLPHDIHWEDVDKSGVYTQTMAEKTCGRKDLNPEIVMGILYFIYPEFVYHNHPTFYKKLDDLFHHTGNTSLIKK